MYPSIIKPKKGIRMRFFSFVVFWFNNSIESCICQILVMIVSKFFCKNINPNNLLLVCSNFFWRPTRSKREKEQKRKVEVVRKHTPKKDAKSASYYYALYFKTDKNLVWHLCMCSLCALAPLNLKVKIIMRC